VISARVGVVQRAVALIEPDQHRRVECFNAVHVALLQLEVSERDLRRMFDRRTKQSKRAVAQLESAVKRLVDTLNDPTIPDDLASIFPDKIDLASLYPDLRWPQGLPTPWHAVTKNWLAWWLQRIESRSDRSLPFRFSAEKKLVAAEQARDLLLQFDRKISAAEGSVFCRLAALLNQTPGAKFHYPCSRVLRVAGFLWK
jgi:hypothetical protein